MKMKLLMSVFASLTILVVDAQFRKIPAEVTDSFKVRFATAEHVTWKDKVGSFQAEFKLGQDDVKANFSSKGDWMKSEKRFAFDKLPAEVKDGFKKSKFAGWPVKEVLEMNDSKEGLQYKVTVKKGDFSKRYLYFSSTGQLLSDSMTL